MATETDLLIYTFVFGLAIIWSLLAVGKQSATFAWLSFITWLTETVIHLIVAYDSNLMSILYLYFGFSLIFFVLGCAWSISHYLQAKHDKDWTFL